MYSGKHQLASRLLERKFGNNLVRLALRKV